MIPLASCTGHETMTDPTAILCIDIDGTLIDHTECIHPNDRQLLQNMPAHIQPVLTTGRILHSARGVLRKNGLFIEQPIPLPGVFMNGGMVCLPHEKIILEQTFTPALRQRLIGLAIKHPTSAFTFFSLKTVHLINPNPFGRHITDLHYLDAADTTLQDVPEQIVKVMILEQDEPTLTRIRQETVDWDAEMAYSLDFAYEINPRGITKANSLIVLLSAMRINQTPIFVAGDAENDLPLFSLAARSFAPNTAHQTVRDKADRIISREPDGILSPIMQEISQI